jgi:tRNA 2-thiouridine synthesizing protein A
LNRKTLDLRTMKCIMIIWNMTSAVDSMKKGDILEVIANCPTFANDVKRWCQKHKKVLIRMKEDRNGLRRCEIKV